MSIRIYVEGGGRGDVQIDCRHGFRKLFENILPKGTAFEVIACGSRYKAIDKFRIALSRYPDEFVVLLVDSEGPVKPGHSAWAHLKERDGWDQPVDAAEDSAHLMVQCMEAWLLADHEALAEFYGQGFQASALPGNRNIEAISKKDLFDALEAATRNTKTKGAYSKGRHSFQLLALVDPIKVRLASPHANRLAEVLLRSAST